MFELSHRLIGIYKTANQTRSKCLHSLKVPSMTHPALAGISIDNQPLHTIPLNAMVA